MRDEFGFLLALTVGALGGLAMSWLVLDGVIDFGSMRVGPWNARSAASSSDANRYVRAFVASSGDLALAPGEGIAFTATEDSNGDVLDGACTYRVAPILPPSRWWTLSLYDVNKGLITTPSRRHGFTSAEILRNDRNDATIVVGPDPLPGNWLPAAPGAFNLVLRLYDSQASTGLRVKSTIPLPDIQRVSCL